MSSDCDTVRQSAAELALGLVDGAERAAALAHLERCAECRTLVGDLTRVVDHLHLAVPPVEPPAGFEGRVMARLTAPSGAPVVAPARGPSRTRQVLLVAAAVLTLVVGGFAASRLTDRRSPPAVTQAAMLTPAGVNVGKAEVGGNPETLLLAMPDWYRPDEISWRYRVELGLSDGTTRLIHDVTLHAGGLWSGPLDVAAHRVRTIKVFSAEGTLLCSAAIG